MKTTTKIVRRPDFAGGGITEEERAKFAECAKEWIAIAFRTDPIEPEAITQAIYDLYAAADLKRPRVVIVPSPLVMAFAGGAAAAIWHLRKKGKGLATRAATYAAAAATADATYAATDAATDAATRAATAAATAADAAVINCIKSWSTMCQGGNMWAYWSCYLSAARDVLGLKLPTHAKYKAWEAAARHGGFRIVHDEFCMVSDFPEILKIDQQNRPHCADGPSHRWRDGWELYHWHGVRVPDTWIKQKGALTAAEALNQQNAELRRAACEILGWESILTQLGAKRIDRDSDPEIGELVEVTVEGRRERFLRVRCGTGRMFALPVPPEMKTALEANAWTYNLDRNLYHPEVRT